MDTTQLKNPTVRAAIEALQRGDRAAWSALFAPNAELYDDGAPRSLVEFNAHALGHERFRTIERIGEDGLEVRGEFHTEQWGDFRSYFRFQLAADGTIVRLDIGQG
jgi:ketosteroid isomerase-like protein